MNRTPDTGSVPFPIDSDPGDDPLVLELVKEYQTEWESGHRPDRRKYLDRHPRLAPVLDEYLDSIDMLHDGVQALSGTGRLTARLDTGLTRGDRLGEFELIREIGRGGMGVVYEARQPSLNRRVAVKVLPTAFAVDRTRLQRFTVEAQAAAAVAHPNIVTVYAIGEDRGIHFYAMRLVDGVSLDRIAADASAPPPPHLDATRSYAPGSPNAQTGEETSADSLVSLSRTNRIAYHRRIAQLGALIARALDHAHQCGVVHRDIKPANLLLDRDGHVWVTDFGLAQLADGPAVTRTGGAVGTLRYMSPEQAAGDRPRLDHRTDIYSLAATIYELATGRPAFPADEPAVLLRQIIHDDPTPPSAVEPAFPTDLETVLLKALQKEPRDRYATAGELADDLERFLAGQPVLARRPSGWDRAKRWAGRHPATVVTALVSLVVVVIASGIATAIVAGEQAETRRAFDELQHANAATQKAQQEADAHARSENKLRLDADALAKSERDRADEAERRFRRAKELGDLILTISEEEMGANGRLQGPRRLLLTAALENSKWLLAGGHADPKVRDELTKVVASVEHLLSEQDLRWEADGAALMKDQHVRAELKLTPDQIKRIDQAFTPPPDKGSSSKGPKGPSRPFEPPGEIKIELIQSLTAKQRQRLRQISIQLRVPMVFNDPEVIDPLNLSYSQRRLIKTILHEELWGGLSGFGGFGGLGKGARPPGADKDAKARAVDRIMDEVLSPEQRDSWRALIGKPYNPPR